MLSDGGGIISESGGDYFSELGGEIISESGGGLPRNLHPRDLAALVEIESGVFLTEDLLDALFIVQARYPDLRSVRQLDIEVGLVKSHPNRREAERQDLWQGIGPDRRLRVVEPEPEYDVPRTRSVYRSLDQRPTKNKRFSRPRSAAEHDVARRAGEKAISLSLFLR
ncbi:hypothetical protein JOH52_002821 [Sinorhizobium meliloti]|nr:hypothetical protein [Sinorhizobium meliloti]